MPQILVLVDHVDGAVRKTTTELLTLARRLGEPAAVFIGQGVDAAQPTLAEFGAAVVYAVEADGLEDYLVLPKVEALSAVIEAAGGAGGVGAVLFSYTGEGKEIAGRLSVCPPESASAVRSCATGMCSASCACSCVSNP